MSHQSTPHLHNKRTPGTLSSDTPSQMLAMAENSVNTANTSQPVLDVTRSVSDNTAANAKQLLNVYIYDFLVKNTLPQTAKLFVAEADIPSIVHDLSHSSAKTSPLLMSNQGLDKDSASAALAATSPQTPAISVNQLLEEYNLPNLALSMDAPQGFLYEWWQVFWDVFQAKNDRVSSPMASQYYQMQAMKQKQQHELYGMDMPQGYGQMMPQAGQMVNQAGAPGPMGPNPHLGISGSAPGQMSMPMVNQLQGPMPMQQRLQFANVDPRQQRYMMQMMMKQQQQQQLQQQHQQPHNQPHQQQLQQQVPQPQQQQQQQLHQHQQHQQQLQQQQQHQQQQPPQQGQSLQLQPPHQQLPQQQTPQLAQGTQPPQQPQQQHHMPGMDQSMNNMGMNMNLQQQMFMQQQPQHQNRIQQQAQTQMNNLRQQAVAAQQHQQHQQHQQGPAAAAVASIAAAAAAAANPHSREGAGPANFNGPRMNQGRPVRPVQQLSMVNMQQQYPPQNMVNAVTPGNLVQQGVPGQTMGAGNNNSGGMGAMPMNQPMQATRNTNALQDYQMQLMLLEKQNKKRLDIARSGTADVNLNMQQIQQPLQMGLQHQAKASPAPSPSSNNKFSPVNATAKPKKAAPVKRGRKSSNVGSTPQSAGPENGAAGSNGRTTGGPMKKEQTTPITQAAEVDNKKKRKSTTGDSPKKLSKNTNANNKEKSTPKLKREEAPKADNDGLEFVDQKNADTSDSDKMPPPSTSYFLSSLSNDKMTVDILGGGNGDANFFNPSGGSGIDDMDFNFLFLEGGDNGLNDTIGFNWGNPIEGGE